MTDLTLDTFDPQCQQCRENEGLPEGNISHVLCERHGREWAERNREIARELLSGFEEGGE